MKINLLHTICYISFDALIMTLVTKKLQNSLLFVREISIAFVFKVITTYPKTYNNTPLLIPKFG